MTDFTTLPDLASARLGGAALYCNDEFFAPKENLVRPDAPVWREGEYTDRGKWMDGWETRRRRSPGFDWCVVRLGLPGLVSGVVVDTSFFRGNFPEAVAIEGCDLPPDAGRTELEAADWFEVLPKSALAGDTRNSFPVACAWRARWLRLSIFPDGGLARLRVHGEALPDLERLGSRGEVDLAAAENGGRIEGASDRFFSDPHHLLLPGASTGMHDGWETKRRRGPGHDWVEVRLGLPGIVHRVEVDTSFFRGNYPDACVVEGARTGNEEWVELVGRSKLQAHTLHAFEAAPAAPVDRVRLSIFPDGGVARLRVWGLPETEGWRSAALHELNSLRPAAAEDRLVRCVGSRAWARAIANARPYTSPAALADAADATANRLERTDWLEAIASHPDIGARASGGWSATEQAGVAGAGSDVRAALAEGNRAYRARFGHGFIVFASGKSAEEMLGLLRARLENDPDRELEVAAGELRKIARLRLDRLLKRAT